MASQSRQDGQNEKRQRRSLSILSKSALRQKLAVKFPQVFKVEPDITSPELPRKRSGPATTFLSLPAELRHQIYSYLSASENSLCRPTSHPYFKFLRVHPTVKTDILNLFYEKPLFSFFTASSCLTFLRLGSTHTHFLTSLTLYLRNTQTQLLELICEELVNGKAPLRHLNIHLERHFYGSIMGAEIGRVVTAYMVPRRIGISALGEQKRHEWRQAGFDTPRRYFNREPRGIQTGNRDYFKYMTKHMALAVDAAKLHDSFLGRIDTLRYLAVHGQPEDEHKANEVAVRDSVGAKPDHDIGKSWKAIDFELAILKLHLKMEEVAKSEGITLQIEGDKHQEDQYWFYEVFLEGEEMEAPRHW